MLSREECIKVLDLNEITYDEQMTDQDLNELVKMINPNKEEPEEKQIEAPAVIIQKNVETNSKEYQKRLEGAGHRVLTEEQVQEVEERQTKSLENKDEMLTMAFNRLAGMLSKDDTTGQRITKKGRIIQEYDGKETEFLRRMETEEKIDIMIPIERNKFLNNVSIMAKQAITNKDGLVLRNGNPVIEDVVSAEINGICKTFSLGIDNGHRSVATVYDVPWPYAKVLAEKYGCEIRNKKTGEMFRPSYIPEVPQLGGVGTYSRVTM